MKKRLIQILALLLVLTLTACTNKNNDTMINSQQDQEVSESQQKQEYAEIGSGAHLVEFPEDLEEGIVFATYDRGDIHEDIYVNSKEAIEAVQNGEELPSGTVITLVGYKDGELDQYLVMEKRTGWGSQYSPEERNGECEFQAFTPDREVRGDNIGRCFTCHANQERDDYMNSMDQIKEFDLGEISGINSSTETPFASIHTENWKVSEISAHMKDSKDVNKEASRLIGNEEKAGIVQEVLLTMYLQQYKS
ncbi:cytochrome P460 family protein [Metabacillus bambusae]|uniref:Cytochrome P460 family protein n=1 Tax=Metabacillus bambusae TaxID=2795218 RepID=A0ABS3MZM0_9BACI|nr:cytochrome P460 family protein [Metabacillus bambusae]MBO1511477.1 cytochrome P460 family protein [Metabacillus bambusae]